MTMLITAAAVFLGIHLLIAGTRLRDVIVGALGERMYLSLFALTSVVTIVWLVISYNAATAQGSEVLWNLGPGVSHLGIPVVLVAFLFVVSGLMTPNPTSVGMEGRAAQAETVSGILRITRHPFLWGAALWAAFHLLANGDAASVVFFGMWVVLAVAGTFSIDAKRARKMGAAWQGFAQRTSNIPFAAILAGRNTLNLGEILTWRQLVALLVFLGALFVHARLFSASPFPGGWAPF